MQNDIITKVLMEKAAEAMLETFLGIKAVEKEFQEELPQEKVNQKQSNYILKIVDQNAKQWIVIWELLSAWKRKSVLNLIDHTVRAATRYNDIPIIPVILLLSLSESASETFELTTEFSTLKFKFKLIRLSMIPADTFAESADIRVLPFVPLMKEGAEFVWEAERRIYSSGLAKEEKSDLLTVMTIFAGLRNRSLALALLEKRKDIMIESAAYDMIKQEGIEEGIRLGIEKGIQQGITQGSRQGQIQRAQKAISDVLEIRFDIISKQTMRMIENIEDLKVLDELHRCAVKVKDMNEFRQLYKRIME